MKGLVLLRVGLDTRAKGESNAHHWEVEELEIVKGVRGPRKVELMLHEELAKKVRGELEGGNLEVRAVSAERFA